MKRFIILTTQRSGSTLLWRYLNGHPNIFACGEMFLAKHGGTNAYAAFRKGSTKRWLNHYIYNKQNVATYLDHFFSTGQDFESCGFKLMYGQNNRNIRSWLIKHNVSIIHLIRENILKKIVSGETMKARGVAHIKPNEMVEDIKIDLDVNMLIPRISAIAKGIRLNSEKFSMLPYLEVYYEDFINDPPGTAEGIFDFLGVTNVSNLEMPLKKVNPDPVELSIGNYSEVRMKLLGTPYAKYLDQ